MAATKEKLPFKISEYINEHFREDFLFQVKDVKKIGEHLYYRVEVTKDDYIHCLQFDEEGELVKQDGTQAFPPDIHEEPTIEDRPE